MEVNVDEVLAVISELPAEERQVLLLRLDGNSFRRMSKLLHISLGEACRLYNWARSDIKKICRSSLLGRAPGLYPGGAPVQVGPAAPQEEEL